ncbi:MAG: 30S ribosomal protein S2 [Ilumatobacteraceae bacterium]|nr:30S ribosomal protein S2 [Ilumatobacteraceae bacterium]
MAVISMRQMLEAGVHFGHQTRRWNPKMRRFIFGERNGIYIIDLEQTLTRVETAYGFVRDLVANGGNVLFVGTKKQAQDPVQSYALKVGMPYVNERWLGGMLTNFETMSKRVDKMLEYERMKASGEFDAMIKKEALLLDRELTKLQRNLGGLRDMKKAPDCVFVIDTKKEHIAVTEANKLGIPVVAIVDTNVDPDVIQFPIPGNDDAIRANSLLVRVIADAVEEGRYIAQRRPKAAGAAGADGAAAEAKPERSPEEEAAFAQAQAEARNAAARAQADREARLTASKQKPADEAPAEASPATEAADGSAPAADVEVADGAAVETDGTTVEASAAAPVDEAPAEAATEAPYGEGSHAPIADDAQPDGFPIKGNADSMLYHTPESPFYGRTVAEVWFADEAAAEAAGFSKPASQQKTEDES